MSNLRPLVVPVAREHHATHALFMRTCLSCDKPFDYCGSCQPGRRYCGNACSEPARVACVRQAQAKYNDRDSDEGREIHRLEEADRRERHGAMPVGDHRCPANSGRLRVAPSTAPHVVAETSDAATSISPVAPSSVEAFELQPEVRPEWTLVASPSLLAAASRRLGDEASCPFCGRQGRIVEVVSVEQWRRRPRRGFAQGP